MRALIKTDNIDNIVTIGEKSTPIPTDDQLIVKVDAFSLNRADYLYLDILGVDWTVGIDFVGTVIKSAENGCGTKVGKRVMVHNPTGGGGAEFAAISINHAIELPDNFDVTIAAALPLAGLMALRLIREANLQSGHHVLITGATGGVGYITTQLAINAGAKVTVLVRDVSTAIRLQKLGATVVSSLNNITESFDIILESIGGEVMAEAIGKLKRNGLILWFGQASGQPIHLDFFSLFGGHESLTLKHFIYNDLPNLNDQADLNELLKLVLDDQLHIDILVEDWSKTGKALQKLKQGQLRGKAVFVVTDEALLDEI